MKIQSFILIALLSAAVLCADVEKEDGVLILDESNFQDVITENDKILVEFYAPWCGHCKKLAPEFAGAAEVLGAQDPSIYIGKVDATENAELAKKYGVSGYPTLKWFVNGEPTEYTGGRTKDTIITWINKRMGPPSASTTGDDLAALVKDAKALVVFFGDESSEEFKTFEAAAGLDDKSTYVHTSESTDAEKHGVKAPGIAFFRDFDEQKVVYDGKFESKDITTFVASESVPTLIEFGEDYIEPIFQKQAPSIFLFRDPESEEQKALIETFGKAASENKGTVLFAYSGVKVGIETRLSEYLGVTEDMLPHVVLFDFGADGVNKYQYTGDSKDFTAEDIKNFIGEWKANNLEKFLKSEDIPETNDAPVKVIVGKNFNELVRDSEDDVLLEFYAPWCGHCKSLEPKYTELAEKLADVKGLVIAKVDGTANEIEGISVSGFPSIKFFAKGSKRAPVDYDGEREVEGFEKWLKDNSESYKTHLENKEDL